MSPTRKTLPQIISNLLSQKFSPTLSYGFRQILTDSLTEKNNFFIPSKIAEVLLVHVIKELTLPRN
jgi:hypothetical protein